MSNYWTATDDYLREHGGPPTCPDCGSEMFAEDDHGRFTCFCRFGSCAPTIPQVDVSALSDVQKAKIPPVNRLNAPPTEAEARMFEILRRGSDAIGSPEYLEAVSALEKERGENSS